MTLVAPSSTPVFSDSTLPFWRCDSSDWPCGSKDDDKDSSDYCSDADSNSSDNSSGEPKECQILINSETEKRNVPVHQVGNIASSVLAEDTVAFRSTDESCLKMRNLHEAPSEGTGVSGVNPDALHELAATGDKIHGCEDGVCDAADKNVERPPDVRPKVFDHKKVKRSKSKSKGGDGGVAGGDIQTRFRRKKDKKSKVREKKNKKWRSLDPVEMGFNLSLLPLPLDETSVEEADPATSGQDPHDDEAVSAAKCVSNSDDNSVDVGTVGSSGANVENLTTLPLSDEIGQSIEDDEAYFSALGIDVTYSGPYDDHVTDWDGLDFNGSVGKESKNNTTNKKLKHVGSSVPKKSTNPSSGKTASSKYFSRRFDFPTLINFNKSDQHKLFELECSSTKRIYLRKDRDRRVQKAHKSVKTKNCKSIENNKGRKKLHMHHRLFKKLNSELQLFENVRSRRIPPMPKGDLVNKSSQRSKPVKNSPPSRPVPAQNLKYALHESNAPQSMENQLSNFLISLQHRDLTPEDYDMLLMLDESVKPKTVSKNVLQRLRTEKVPDSGLETMCAVCMEPYIAGQERKFLPCGHDFHSGCIDTWLNNSSMNCPLDGLPVDGS